MNTAHVEWKNKGDAYDNSGHWIHFKILQKILDQNTRKARSQGTTENKYIEHNTHTLESTTVEAQGCSTLKTA
jgi:hypothetical protein